MKQFHCLALLAAGVASSPIEILNYEAAEAGHGQVMSGTPGEAVVGEFYWKAPEGDDIKLVYTADMAVVANVLSLREGDAMAEVDDMAVVAEARKRRDLDAKTQVQLTQPL